MNIHILTLLSHEIKEQNLKIHFLDEDQSQKKWRGGDNDTPTYVEPERNLPVIRSSNLINKILSSGTGA